MAPRGPCLLAVDDTHSVHLVNLETGRRVTVFPASRDTADVNTHRLCFSPDGSSFLVQRSNYLRPDVIELRDASDGRVLATCPVRQMGWCGFWDVLGPEQGGPALVFGLGRSAWRWQYDTASPSRGRRSCPIPMRPGLLPSAPTVEFWPPAATTLPSERPSGSGTSQPAA